LEYPKNRTKLSAPYPILIFFVLSSYLLRYFHPPIEAKRERTGYDLEEFLTVSPFLPYFEEKTKKVSFSVRVVPSSPVLIIEGQKKRPYSTNKLSTL
jgi:hypothetical protein